MSKSPEMLRQEFEEFFADPAYHASPGRIERTRKFILLCDEIMDNPMPSLWETLQSWREYPKESRLTRAQLQNDSSTWGVLFHALAFAHHEQFESAWALCQLHYDQVLKEEARTGQRHESAHPTGELAFIARALRSPSLTRHYAMLSSVGEILLENRETDLRMGGHGMTMLEPIVSLERQVQWRQRVRETLQQSEDHIPLYLEAFVAGDWFKSCGDHVRSLANVACSRGLPFPEVLLNAVDNPPEATRIATRDGTRFEAATGLLLASTPGFRVERSVKSWGGDEQIDLVVRFVPEPLSELDLVPGFGLVECKSSQQRVSAADLREFGAKCLFHRVRFGILGTLAGISGENRNALAEAELVRRRFQVDGLTILHIKLRDLRNKSRNLRGIQDALQEDYQRLVFGDDPADEDN
jgi:hypothetical protein